MGEVSHLDPVPQTDGDHWREGGRWTRCPLIRVSRRRPVWTSVPVPRQVTSSHTACLLNMHESPLRPEQGTDLGCKIKSGEEKEIE